MNLMRTPRSMDISITSRCNLRCRYCYHFDSPRSVEMDLPADEWLTFFEELSRCAVLDVKISGGEPLLRKDFKQIINGVVKNRMRFSLLTNGALMTDHMAGFIANTRRCNGVQISIDGSCAEIHDSFRSKGGFNGAVKAVQLLQSKNVPVRARVTLHKKNIDDIENTARFLLEDLALPMFSVNSVYYMGLCRENKDAMMLNTADRTKAMAKLLNLSQKYGRRIKSTSGPLTQAKTWTAVTRGIKQGRTVTGGGRLSACNGVFRMLAVRSDGMIIPCNQLPHIELGRINKVDLKNVWQNHPQLKRLRERKAIPLDRFEFCKGCEYTANCTGSCPGVAYSMTGSDEHPNPDDCLRNFLEDGGVLPDECCGQ